MNINVAKEKSLEKTTILLQNFKFQPSKLYLDEKKIIEIKIGQNINEFESRLYKDNERNFMIYIEEIDLILPKMYS